MSIHGERGGMAEGFLSPEETSIIQGALDLTSLTASHAMTPLDKVARPFACVDAPNSECNIEMLRVFSLVTRVINDLGSGVGGRPANVLILPCYDTIMLQVYMVPRDMALGREQLSNILRTGHSRIPVHVPGNPQDVVGLLLVKELVLLDPDDEVRCTVRAPILSSASWEPTQL